MIIEYNWVKNMFGGVYEEQCYSQSHFHSLKRKMCVFVGSCLARPISRSIDGEGDHEVHVPKVGRPTTFNRIVYKSVCICQLMQLIQPN